MTIAELIAKLSQFDPQTRVMVRGNEDLNDPEPLKAERVFKKAGLFHWEGRYEIASQGFSEHDGPDFDAVIIR